MKTSENILCNCLFWHTEISMYRLRISEMKRQMQSLKSRLTGEESTNKTHALIMQRIQIAFNKLHLVETKIIYMIKKQTNNTSSVTLEATKHSMENEDDLFENMKYCYNLFIDLQKSMYVYFKERTAVKQVSKVIQLASIKGLQDSFKTQLVKQLTYPPTQLQQQN